MNKLRAFVYIVLALAIGMVIQYATWQAAFLQGRVIGQMEFVLFSKDFQSAMQAKTPFIWADYTLLPHTNEKKALVKRTR